MTSYVSSTEGAVPIRRSAKVVAVTITRFPLRQVLVSQASSNESQRQPPPPPPRDDASLKQEKKESTHKKKTMDDDFGADQDFLNALAASETSSAGRANGPARPANRPPPPPPPAGPQPITARIQQPTPQRLDKRPPPGAVAGNNGVKQPTPQALPQRSAGSSILVSPRQKGNPVLACLKSMPWEYSDIPADYGLGLTTCALFLR